jgi:tetratricopeptide (TPR) repeat protein
MTVFAALLATLVFAQVPTSGSTVETNGCSGSPYDCAMADVERQEFDAAIRTLDRLVTTSPAELKALNLLGIALTGAGRTKDANLRFRQALKIDPTFVPARKNLAVNEFNSGKVLVAQRHFEQVLQQSPEDPVAHVHLGEIAFAQKRLAAARAHYEKSGARVLQQPLWTLHYASCLLDQHETAKAITILDQLPAADADSYFLAGVALGQAGAYADAARFFAAARTGYKDPYAAGYNQTLMLIEAGEHQTAIDVAQGLFDQAARPAELYSLVSRAFVGAGRLKDAYDALREAARLEPTVETHYLDLALICLDHENYDLGLEIVDVGLKYRPDSGPLHLQRGVVLAMKGMMEQAEPEFERARQLVPDGAGSYVALAMTWMQTGRTVKAVDMLRERARADKSNAAIQHMLGVALMRSGLDPAEPGAVEAVHAFEAAIRLDPRFGGAYAELGKLLLKRDQLQPAIVALERAVALDPEHAAPAYSLAQAYRRSGQTARAQELLARVSRLNARERGDDPDADLKRMVVRIIREGSTPSRPPAP